MSTRGKTKRPAKAAVPETWQPSAMAGAFRLNAEAWRREADPVDDPEARAELLRHRAAAMGTLLGQLTKHRPGRRQGAKGKRTTMLEGKFDALYRANPDCSAEEARTLKARGSLRKMSRANFAKHWKAAKTRAKLHLSLAPD